MNINERITYTKSCRGYLIGCLWKDICRWITKKSGHWTTFTWSNTSTVNLTAAYIGYDDYTKAGGVEYMIKRLYTQQL